MNLSLGVKSLLLFVLSVVFLVLLTWFESFLSGLSNGTERLISFVLLVLPGGIGIVLGVLGVVRKESKRWAAYLGVLFNTLFALFHLLVIAFAG
jgi:hypothetical protein